jgi:uncharacterized protein YbjT (DUF2867 family)
MEAVQADGSGGVGGHACDQLTEAAGLAACESRNDKKLSLSRDPQFIV